MTVREDLEQAVAELNAYYGELEGESPRAAAILAVSALETEMEKLIASKFPPTLTRQMWKEIAGPAKPLGSFKAKNDFCRAFGFYGSQTKSWLHAVSVVRNKFAHETDARDFTHPRINEECSKLAFNSVFPFDCTDQTNPQDIREGFLSFVQTLAGRLEQVRLNFPEFGMQPPHPLP